MSWLAILIVSFGFVCLVLLFLLALLRAAASFDCSHEAKARELVELEALPCAHEWRRHGEVGTAHFRERRVSF